MKDYWLCILFFIKLYVEYYEVDSIFEVVKCLNYVFRSWENFMNL